MNAELQNILSYMEKERGLDRETLIQAVEYALQSAAKRSLGRTSDLRVQIDRKTCAIKALAIVQVVDRTVREKREDQVSIDQALKTHPDAQIGDYIEIEVTPKDFGRIAAQTAKQAIIQKIRQAEKDVVYEEFRGRIGDIVSGTVRQFTRSDIHVDLGRAEALMPGSQRVPTEEYQVGDRIRAYVQDVRVDTAGPGMEVSEISDGIVQIKAIAREPGYRTKIAVVSKDEKVDPVGACVGMRGMRVKNIVRELSGEKIDIIRWSDDVKTCVANALSPAKLSKVFVDADDPRVVHVVSDPDQLSLAIGKRGQNVRLTCKLLGLKIDIQKDESGATFEEKVAKAISSLASVEGISGEQADALVKAGFLTVEGILAADTADIAQLAGMDEAAAKGIQDAAARQVDRAGHAA
jgi:N utilization substance protein A